jgi:putative transposase
MAKIELPEGWVHQAYRFEVDRPSRHGSISSHEGARRFTWNWGLDLVESQLHARDAYQVLALRQGATVDEATAWARELAPVSWSLPAIRRIWNEEKDDITPRWAESSKECYSAAFDALGVAFKNYFDSRSGARSGSRVGWPKDKRRCERQSVAFTTGAIAVLDRHSVQLPVIGRLRVKEPTTKLGERLVAGTARILRVTLTSDGQKTFVGLPA